MRGILRISFLFSALCAFQAIAEVVPVPARTVGYNEKTYDADFSSLEKHEVLNKNGLYPFRFFGWDYSQDFGIKDKDGYFLLSGSSSFANGHIATATRHNGKFGFVGHAFGGGGYFEAVLRFNPKSVDVKKGWPSFWALSIEGAAGVGEADQWPGYPDGFKNTVEIDIFEYMFPGKGAYGATLHNWYGIKGITCPPNYCRYSTSNIDNLKIVPPGTDFSEFHSYAVLWVPAKENRSGYIRFYFDGSQIGSAVLWEKMDLKEVSKGASPETWAFSSIDKTKYFLILGSGRGQDLSIKSIRVWQAGFDQNLNVFE